MKLSEQVKELENENSQLKKLNRELINNQFEKVLIGTNKRGESVWW